MARFNKRSQKEQTVIYPIFDGCKVFTLDQFWRDKFTQMSFNKFPPGMRYDSQNHNLIVKMGGKTEVYTISEKDLSKTFKVIVKLLKEKYDMRSSRDIQIKKEQMVEIMKKREIELNCAFKDIKYRHLKDQLLTQYATTLKIEYNLLPAELARLKSKIQLGFQFHALASDDVVYSNGVVTDIRGLEFDPDSREFTIPNYPKTTPKSEKQNIQDRFYSELKTYLKENVLRTKST